MNPFDSGSLFDFKGSTGDSRPVLSLLPVNLRDGLESAPPGTLGRSLTSNEVGRVAPGTRTVPQTRH